MKGENILKPKVCQVNVSLKKIPGFKMNIMLKKIINLKFIIRFTVVYVGYKDVQFLRNCADN